MTRHLTLALLTLLAVAAPRLHASEDIRKALAELAVDVKKILDGKGVSEVALGKFDGPPSHKTAAGPGFSTVLEDELKKLQLTVREQAKYGIEGRYSLTEQPATDPGDAAIGKRVLALRVTLEVIDAFDNRDAVNFQRVVLNNHGKGDARVVPGVAPVLKAFGGNVPLKPANTEMENDGAIRKKLIEQPTCHLTGTQVQSAVGQPFAVEVVVEGQPRAATDKDGLAFVAIGRGESYAIKLINRATFEAAAQVSIDGLSVYTFSELRQPERIDGKPNPKAGEPLYTAVIVPAAKGGEPGTAVVRGWHRTNKAGGEDSFLVTEYAKSAASRLKRTEGLGMIAVTFQAAWEGGIDNAPVDEPGRHRGGLGDATGFGKPTGAGFREVRRTLGVIRDCVSVRYTIPAEQR